MKKYRIILGSDHAGFELKEFIKKELTSLGYEVEDHGAFKLDKDDDYPDFIVPVAEKVSTDIKRNRGIIFGGSGQGEAIAANKVKGVRAGLYYGHNPEIVKLSRTHNNCNVLSLGARFISRDEALAAVKLWLETDFSGEKRHERRIGKISKTEIKDAVY